MSTPNPNGPAKRSVAGHFRISENVYAALQREADRQMVSLNTLVNQVLYNHAYQEVPISKGLFVMMPKSVFQEFLAAVTEEKLRQIAQDDVQSIARSLILARHGKITTDAIVEDLHLYATGAGYGEFGDVSDGGKRIVTIMHEFGQKGSVFFAAHAEALFQLIGLRPVINVTSGGIIMEITPPRT